MIVLLDTAEDLAVCAGELGCEVGQLLTPLTKRRLQLDGAGHWAIDNGAYARFEQASFVALLGRHAHHRGKCMFVAAPDVVGSARRTLEVFERWKEKLCDWPLALVIQDGQGDLPIPWDDIAAVFIGGTTEFKVSEEAACVIKAAQLLGKWVHVGRVNTPPRFEYFEDLGVHSIDGTGISRYSHMREGIARRDAQAKLELEREGM